VSVVDLTEVSVALAGQRILDGVSLSVDRGRLVGLVGPNGAGKTSLLRVLKGTLSPDEGRVAVDGRSLSTLSARERARLVASTPQETGLSFDFPVRKVVEMGRTPHVGRFERFDEHDRAAVERAMERASVTELADRPVTSLSGGERQRVLLARALAQSTPVLLLDEPTASLDVNHAVRTLELLRSLVADGKAAVAAIHDLNLAARYCDELVVLTDGAVRAAGPPADVLTTETLGAAFGAHSLVTSQPDGSGPLVTPLPSGDDRPTRRVHVTGGGSRAATVVARLVADGHDVTVGVVPSGDAAAERAASLDCQAVTVPPFAGVDAAARDRAVEHAAAADAVVAAGTVGEDNRPVLDAAERLLAVEGADGSRPVTDGEPVALAALPERVAALPAGSRDRAAQ